MGSSYWRFLSAAACLLVQTNIYTEILHCQNTTGCLIVSIFYISAGLVLGQRHSHIQTVQKSTFCIKYKARAQKRNSHEQLGQ